MTNNCHACIMIKALTKTLLKYACLRLCSSWVSSCVAPPKVSRSVVMTSVTSSLASWFRPDYLRHSQSALQEALKFYA